MTQADAMKQFLQKEFDERQGLEIFSLQQKKLRELIGKTAGKTASQRKRFCKTILPRVALYLTLRLTLNDGERVLMLLNAYMAQVGEKAKRTYQRFEKIPGFYRLFRRTMAHVVAHSDNWVSQVVRNDREVFTYRIKKCLWHDACVENGCPELCGCFCCCDDIIYGSLHTVAFKRTNALGFGDACCDFCFQNVRFKAKQSADAGL